MDEEEEEEQEMEEDEKVEEKVDYKGLGWTFKQLRAF